MAEGFLCSKHKQMTSSILVLKASSMVNWVGNNNRSYPTWVEVSLTMDAQTTDPQAGIHPIVHASEVSMKVIRYSFPTSSGLENDPQCIRVGDLRFCVGNETCQRISFEWIDLGQRRLRQITGSLS